MNRGSCFRRNDRVKALAFNDLFSLSLANLLTAAEPALLRVTARKLEYSAKRMP